MLKYQKESDKMSKRDKELENELFVNHIKYKRKLIEKLKEARKEQ